MKGRLEKALEILQVMAKVNGHQFPSAFKEKLEARVAFEKHRKVRKKEENVGAFDLCKFVFNIRGCEKHKLILNVPKQDTQHATENHPHYTQLVCK